MPILTYESLDAVPEDLRTAVKQLEGSEKFTVNVVPSAKIDEFRDNNIAVSKERDQYKSDLEPLRRIVGEDPGAFETQLTELREIAQRVKDGDLKESRSVEEAVGKRTDEMRKSFETQLQSEAKEKLAWKQRYDSLEQTHKRNIVASYVKDACVADGSGVEPAAIEDIVARAQSIFRVGDDGKITALEGDATIYGSDGTSSMTAKEWLVRLKESKGFLFKQTVGGGGGGDTTKATKHGVAPERLKAMTASERLSLANGEKITI